MAPMSRIRPCTGCPRITEACTAPAATTVRTPLPPAASLLTPSSSSGGRDTPERWTTASCATHPCLQTRGRTVSWRATSFFTFEPDGFGTGEPATQVVYTHTIENAGNVADLYQLTWTSSQEWAAVISEPSPLDLLPGATGVVTVTITIPEGDVRDSPIAPSSRRPRPRIRSCSRPWLTQPWCRGCVSICRSLCAASETASNKKREGRSSLPARFSADCLGYQLPRRPCPAHKGRPLSSRITTDRPVEALSIWPTSNSSPS